VQAVERGATRRRPRRSALFGPGHDHIGLPFAAAGTDEPLVPIEDAGVFAPLGSELSQDRPQTWMRAENE
jgi:hypothetical protein